MTRTTTTTALAAALLCVGCIVPMAPAGGGSSGQPASANQPSRAGQPGQPAPAHNAEPAESKPAAPTVVGVDLKNNCKQTVKLFFGDKPKFGSGTYSSLSSNTRTRKQFRPGDMVWLVDDSQNGLSSVTVDDRTREVEVTADCTRLSAR